MRIVSEGIDAKTFIKDLSLDSLNKAVQKSIGVKTNLSISTTKGSRVIIEDKTNYASKSGIFSNIFKEVFAKVDYCQVGEDNTMSGSVELFYENHRGGRNGQDVLYFQYDFPEKTWQFRNNAGKIFTV